MFADEERDGLRSLGEALLDGHIGKKARELLDDPRVYLGAEGDVQEAYVRARLEELLQRGSAHQASTCPEDRSQQGEDDTRRKRTASKEVITFFPIRPTRLQDHDSTELSSSSTYATGTRVLVNHSLC